MTKTQLSMAVFLALTSCGEPNPEHQTSDTSGSATAIEAQPYYAKESRYFPITKYQNFPSRAQKLMQFADIEDGHCRGIQSSDPATLGTCNRRDELMVQLENLGVCWGAEKSDPFGFEEHWLMCQNDPTYRTGARKVS